MSEVPAPAVEAASLASPDHYLFGWDGNDAAILAMDRAAYRRSIFLDNRIQPATDAVRHLAADEMPAMPKSSIGWIFHVAHCGSTLLARALDRPHGGLVLREPFALRQLALQAVSGAGDAGWQKRLALTLGLLGRRYDASKPTIVKANVPVNFMLPALLDAATPAVLLYFPLADYLAAVLRNEGNRSWVRRITGELAPAITMAAGPMPSSDAGRAAALWLAQMRCYADALSRFPNVHSLDAETFFTTPAPVLAGVATLFGQVMGDAEIADVLGGPLFRSYSKNPAAAFDNEARLARKMAAMAALRDETAEAKAWVQAACIACPLPDRLARPLVAAAPQRNLLD